MGLDSTSKLWFNLKQIVTETVSKMFCFINMSVITYQKSYEIQMVERVEKKMLKVYYMYVCM